MRGEDWKLEDVIEEFGKWGSVEELKKAMEIVEDSRDGRGKDTYKKKMNLVRMVLREWGYKDIPFRSGYYKRKDEEKKEIEVEIDISCVMKRKDTGEEIKVILPTYECRICRRVFIIGCVEDLDINLIWCPRCAYSLIKLGRIKYERKDG